MGIGDKMDAAKDKVTGKVKEIVGKARGKVPGNGRQD